jgi:LacI family transcriptional regulator
MQKEPHTMSNPSSNLSTSGATIADIARQAGVGTATVDRVINGRLGVNAETALKVKKIIERIGNATPQRGRPRRRDNLRLAFILPSDNTPFLDLVERQIAQLASDFRHQHITEVTHRLDATDPAAFALALNEIVNEGQFDGVALLAPDLPVVKLAINALVRSNVHVVTLLSDVAGSKREVYIGADNRAAGRTAGLLLGRMAGIPGRTTVLLASQATRLSGEIERRIGFAQVIEERFAHLEVVRTPDLPNDDTGAHTVLRDWLGTQRSTGNIAGIYNVGAGSAGIAQALKSLNLASQIPVIAHDVTDAHRSLLGSDQLAYVLDQNIHYCLLSAAKVLQALCDNVRGAIRVAPPRLDILTAENLF